MREGGRSLRTDSRESRLGSACRAVIASLALLLLLLSSLSGCSGQDESSAMATREDCEELRAIEARLVVASAMPARPTAAMAAELARHQTNLSAAGGEESLARCMEERTAASVACARRAKNLDELGVCARPSTSGDLR